MKNKEICASCKSRDFTTLFTVANHKILQCKNCGLVRTAHFKAPTYKTYHRDAEYFESELFFRYIFQKRVDIIKRFKPSPGRVLDIGAATGVMLDIYKGMGWKTFGIEPSQSAQIAQEKGHNVKRTSLEKSDIKGVFDLIIANHVLEHIENPQLFLKDVRRLMKKDSVLYIDVPNFGSWRSRRMKAFWPYLLTDEHVHHFTRESLTYLLQICGFEVLYVTSRSGLFETSHPFLYLWNELIHFKKNFFSDIFSAPLDLFVTTIDRGDSMGVVARVKTI